MFTLVAGLLTVSGCGFFGGDKKAEDTAAESKSIAANEAEATTVVASAEGVEQSATEVQKVEEAVVETAQASATMPMNEEKAA